MNFFQKLIKTSPIGVYIVQNENFISVSPRFQEITGYSEKELLDMHPLDIIFPEDREIVKRAARKMLERECLPPYEFRIVSKDGKTKWIIETVTSIRYQGKRAILGNFMDITRRKEAERVKTLLYRISDAAISASGLEELFTSMHQIIREVMPAENFSVALYDPDHETVSFPYFVDERDKRPSPRRSANGLTEYVIRTGMPLLATSEVFKDLIRKGEVEPLGAPFVDWLGIPLKVQDRVIGAFAIQSYDKVIRYGEKEKDLLTIISDQISLAVDRMQKQRELQKTQELLQGILSSSPLGIALAEHRIIKWTNRAMAKIFGYEDMDEIIGKNSRILYASEEEYERVGSLVYSRIEKGEPFGTDAKFRRKDGSVFDGHIVASALDPSFAEKRTVAIFSDISWRKEAEAALNREKESLLVTLRSIGDGVIATDASGNIVLMNGVAEKLTGWKEDEARGRPLNEIFNIINEKTREPCENPVDKVIETGGVIGLANHTMLISREGTERILADSGAPIRDRDGKIIGVVLVFRDVTEKRRIERELQKMEKLESIGVLAGGIAHDFNNILMGILGNISLAKMYITFKDKVLERLAEAEKASLQAKNLTQQLLTFSKGGMPIKKIASIRDLLKDSVTFSLRGSNVRCEFSLPDDLWSVEIDEGQMNQVINNLVINAQQAMPGGGIINVRAENIAVGKDSGLPLEEGRYIKIGIEDHGIGISKKHLSKIFDPYFTTKQRGSGLGLTTAYSIVKNHDGYIRVESRLGKGTRFDIYLPASRKSVITDRRIREISPVGKGRILLMDDEEIVRDVASEMFRSIGYEFESAKDGLEAIEMYKKAKESGNPFDVVIMDLTVPGGMGGKEAIKRLLEIDPQAKAIVSSGYSNDPIMSDFRSYGFVGVVAKPYHIKDMMEVIPRVISGGDKRDKGIGATRNDVTSQ